MTRDVFVRFSGANVGSTRSHSAPSRKRRRIRPMGSRTRSAHPFTCVCVYREPQRLSCLTKRHTDVHSAKHDREPYGHPIDVPLTLRMQHRPTFILSGVDPGLHEMGGESAYSQYVRHLEKSSLVVQAAKTEGSVEHFAQGYQDYLQNPLQVCP